MIISQVTLKNGLLHSCHTDGVDATPQALGQFVSGHMAKFPQGNLLFELTDGGMIIIPVGEISTIAIKESSV